MKYYSTRDKSNRVSAAEAIVSGLAKDGGLFLPERIPVLSLDEISALCEKSYPEKAAFIMGLFLEEFSKEELSAFTQRAYGENFDDAAIAPTRFLDDQTAMLELWHGPTSAFKDMALQILPLLLTGSLKKTGETREACILVATSGDTGKAALEGFADVPGTSIVVFYPRDGVSEVQKLQMTTQSGKNVLVSAVEGNFDDAQTGVKQIFGDRDFARILDEKGWFLSSANSINWGRLLPQTVYYFSAYCDYVRAGHIKLGDKLDFCVPTGNFGDILAGWYAKEMGLPVRRLICASNSNKVLTDFFETGVYDRNREFFTTISPSMDILISSNLERLLFMLSDDAAVKGWMRELKETGAYRVNERVLEALRRDFAAGFAGDEEAKAQIQALFTEKNYLMDPHTAVAYEVLSRLREEGETFPTVLVSTASPYKFCESVLEALGEDGKAAEPIARLQRRTKTKAPAPLTGLEAKDVRFSGCIEKEKLSGLVLDFLSKTRQRA